MKILFLYYSPWWNATAYYGVTLARGIRKKGNQVWFGTNKESPGGLKAKDSGLDIFDVKLETVNPFRFIIETWRIARFVKREKIAKQVGWLAKKFDHITKNFSHEDSNKAANEISGAKGTIENLKIGYKMGEVTANLGPIEAQYDTKDGKVTFGLKL